MEQAFETRSRTWLARAAAGGAAIAVMMFFAATARSEPPATAYGASPLPAQAERRFCYYAGMAYSLGATISVEAPIRREVVTDRARKILRCVSGPDSTGRHHWQDVNPDEGDPFRD